MSHSFSYNHVLFQRYEAPSKCSLVTISFIYHFSDIVPTVAEGSPKDYFYLVLINGFGEVVVNYGQSKR